MLYRCAQCGYLQQVEALYAPDVPLEESLRKKLTIRWKSGAPSSQEIAALRRLSPKYEAMPLGELHAFIKTGELALGEYEDWDARELVKRGTELGLDIFESQIELQEGKS